MPITQIPFQDPVAPPENSQPEQLGLYDYDGHDWESAYRELDARVPHLLIQLQDDLTRSRRREAAWISIITHLVLAILLINVKLLEKMIPARFLVVATPKDVTKNRDVTFLELPPDLQKPPAKSKSNIVSDKNRIAMTPLPELDKSKVMPSPPPGRPGLSGPKAPSQPSPQQQTMAQNQPQQQSPQSQQQTIRPAQDPNITAQLQIPAKPQNDFSKYTGSMSAGSSIQQATQAAANSRRAGAGGQEGDFGLGTGAHGRQVGALDILSDTQGVDFEPYLQRILHDVRENWYHLIPESAEMKKGKLALEFAIMKDGRVAGLKLVTSSGDVTLDRPAWGSITASDPFPPLPNEFGGQYLALRFRFYYNPDKADLQ
jgi:TonB family protein